MRIGIVWPCEWIPLARTSIRLDRYARGFLELGHEPVVVTTQAAGADFPWPVRTVPDAAALEDPALWGELKLDVAVVFSWLVYADLIKAVRPHVRHLIAVPDSDGVAGVQVFPRALLQRMWVGQSHLFDRLRTLRWWAFQALGLDRGQDVTALEILRAADQIVVYSPGARDHFAAFLQHHGEAQIVQRFCAVPYPVDPAFETMPVAVEREERVVAIGRWNDPQKDVDLLVRGIQAFLRSGGTARFTLLGPAGESRFRPLLRDYPGQVEYLGSVATERVSELLGRSQCLLSSSRWESGPIVASEALLRGATLVGPASIPSFRHFCANGGGTLFEGRSPRALAQALTEELADWQTGRRRPTDIAGTWRGQFGPRVVCAQILAALGTNAAGRTDDLVLVGSRDEGRVGVRA
jgi:glycosyltransferase involved in cell wall biosynthesis